MTRNQDDLAVFVRIGGRLVEDSDDLVTYIRVNGVLKPIGRVS